MKIVGRPLRIQVCIEPIRCFPEKGVQDRWTPENDEICLSSGALELRMHPEDI